MVAANDLPPIEEPAGYDALVELSDRLQWSAPELAVQFARRAIARGPAAGAPELVRAHGLAATTLVRLGRCADAVEPALAALHGAEPAGLTEVAALARLDLAECARELGEPLLGCTILGPVLDTPGARPATRAGAIWQLAGCTVHVGRRDDLEDLLAEADRLLAADDRLSPDARLLERGLLAARTAAYHRRHGETEDAIESAREGLGLLVRLRDGQIEGGRVWARLILELVLALLDDDQPGEAEHQAGPLFARPVRAAGAPAVGRTLLAVATRVMVPAGRVDAARGLLDYVLSLAERHTLDWLLADALSLRADLDERAARPAEALHGLRGAHAAEQRHRRSVEVARRRLVLEFGLTEPGPDAVTLLLRGVVRRAVAAPVTQPVAPPPAQALLAGPEPFPAPAAPVREHVPAPPEPVVDEADLPVALTVVRLDLAGGSKPAGNGAVPAADVP
ncbi:MAG TPA: hypothetical protein VFO68_22610, partial [Actinophytocola sp.]|nr:hypothetical protein [Actinophytocola sp.]